MAEKHEKAVIADTCETVEKQLTCPSCQNRYNQPRILSCLHSFCHDCLCHFPVSIQRRVTCIVCRQTTQLPDNGVSEFQSGVFINNVQELYEMIKKSQQSSCDNCHKERSNGYCKQCSVLLCQTCIDVHNRWAPFTSHQIVGVDDVAATTISNQINESNFSQQLPGFEKHVAELKEQIQELEEKLRTFQKEHDQRGIADNNDQLQKQKDAKVTEVSDQQEPCFDTLNKENGQLKQQVLQMQEEGARQHLFPWGSTRFKQSYGNSAYLLLQEPAVSTGHSLCSRYQSMALLDHSLTVTASFCF